MKNPPIKLHLGCGYRKIHGYLNVDALASLKPDVVADVFRLRDFKAGSVELIYACHVLEHAQRHTYRTVLARWFTLLRHGGTLRIATPDLRAAMTYYLSNGDLRDIIGLRTEPSVLRAE